MRKFVKKIVFVGNKPSNNVQVVATFDAINYIPQSIGDNKGNERFRWAVNILILIEVSVANG